MKMKKWILILCTSLVALAIAGCGADVEESAGGFDLKEEVRDRNDGVDYCDRHDWYGDGECDEFCTESDPDCSNACAAVDCCVDLPHPEGCCEGAHCTPPPPVCPSDSEVDYVPGSQEDYSICLEDNWGCASAPEGIFNAPECGCGCYIEDTTCPSIADPDVTYVAESPEECALVDYQCGPDEESFSDACGCGCTRIPACLDADDPDVEYVGESVEECTVILFSCAEGEEYFQNECGCGCVSDDARPDYCESPLLNYFSEDPSDCAVSDFACSEGVGFDHPECGCGCYVEPPTCVNDVDCKPGYCDLPPTQVLNGGRDIGGPPVAMVCHPTSCEDEPGNILCESETPDCEGARIAVIRDGCWKCVDPRTCE